MSVERAKILLKNKLAEKYSACIDAGCTRSVITDIGSGSTIISCKTHDNKEIFYTGE